MTTKFDLSVHLTCLSDGTDMFIVHRYLLLRGDLRILKNRLALAGNALQVM